MDEDVLTVEEDYRIEKKKKAHEENTNTPQYFYRLNEIVGDFGVRYFGQQQTKGHAITAMFICPLCNELWRTNTADVRSGRSKSCGCSRGRKTGSET